MIIMWVVCLILAVLSIILLTGKGGFLIAGYNTASPENKAKYDEKKLCRVTGMGLLILTILFAVMTILGEHITAGFLIFFCVASFADMAGLIYVANTQCYAAESLESQSISREEKRQDRTIALFICAAMFVLFAGIGFILVSGDICTEYTEQGFAIHASYWDDMELSYDEIEQITYLATYDGGTRMNGFGSPKLQMGKFCSDELGSYTRYTYTECPSCICLTVSGKPILFSGKNDEETKIIYEELCRQLSLQ